MSVPPAVPHHAVDRPHLRALLDLGIDAPLSLVVAPAGSGKTVLLAQWAALLATADVAWMELSAPDDDAVRFAGRFVDGLGRLHPAFRELDAALGVAGGGLGDPMIEALVAAFADVPRRIVVVFDDMHRLANADLVGDLWRLVDMLPPNIHFVFSSRVDLRLGWSRHRLQHGLVEIRAAQLAFEEEAAEGLLTRISQRPIEPATVTAVVRRTEGWAAGVQLAALRLRVHPQAEEQIVALAEGDRLATDYLSEEVLSTQSPGRRRALLELSVLEEMSAGLVETMTGVPDGTAFLEDLDRESLFIVPVHGTPGRYRFHQLFRDLLRLRLRADDPTAEARLLHVAAEWHRAHGTVNDVIDCLLAAGAWTEALDVILRRGRDVYERGETATAARWLAAVPPAVLETRPEAIVLRGMLEGMAGRAAIAEDLLRSVIDREGVPIGTQLVARAFAASGVQFHAPPQRYLDDGHAMLSAADAAGDASIPVLLQITPLSYLRTVAMISIGRAHLFLGEADEAVRWLGIALAAEGAGYAPYRIHGLGSLAITQAIAGRLRAATDAADEALDLARELSLLTHAATADAYLARALVAIQRGRPETGALALHEGYVRATSNNRTQLMWIAHMASRLVDPYGTDVAAIAPVGPPPPLVSDILRGIEHRQRRAAGAPSAPPHIGFWSFTAFEAVAGLLSRGDTRRARAIMSDVRMPGEPAPSQLVEVQVLRGWLAAIEGHRADSRTHLEAALDTAAPEHLVHPFLRAGPAVVTLLESPGGAHAAFQREIVSRFHALLAPAERLADPLTARELELLAYLPSRLTNAELAARCFVSVNTVKTHMAHIYRKLDASGRDAAIVRARELGLLREPDIARTG